MSWNNTFREYVNMDPSLLKNIAFNEADNILMELQVVGGYSYAKRNLLMIFGCCINADGNHTREEYSLFCKITGGLLDEEYSYSEFVDIVYKSERWDDSSLRSCMQYSDDLRNSVVKFCCAVAAIDDTISVSEQRLAMYFDDM